MKKAPMFKGFIAIINLILIFTVAVSASAADTSCKTKYPIILAHGVMFVPDSTAPTSFGGIPAALKAKGATVYCTVVQPYGDVYAKASQFKEQFMQIKALNGSAKFNIMGHSHGGIYTRWAITNLGLSKYVASLTTVSSPHRGTQLSDMMNDINNISPTMGALLAGFMAPDASTNDATVNNQQLTTTYMTGTFNPKCPDVSGVYYQSWNAAFTVIDTISTTAMVLNMMANYVNNTPAPTTMAAKVKQTNDMLPTLASAIFFLGGGYNDGLVPTYSSKWGTFLGTQTGAYWHHGVSHMEVVDGCPNPGWSAVNYWVSTVQALKNKGY